MIRRRIHHSAKRIIAATLVIVVLGQIAACASVPKSFEKRAEIFVPAYHTNGRVVHVSLLDGRGQPIGSMKVVPGRHMIQIETEWSNGRKDTTYLTLDAEPGREYLVFAYELKPGQNPVTAEIRPATDLEKLGIVIIGGAAAGAFGGLLPLVIMAAPIWVPILWVCGYMKHREPPMSRPYENCCFVWIEDRKTGDIVAGISPSRAREGTKGQ